MSRERDAPSEDKARSEDRAASTVGGGWQPRVVGQARWHKHWPRRRVRHVWVRTGPGQHDEPLPGLVLDWRREREGQWSAFVVTPDGCGGASLAWLPSTVLAPVRSGPAVLLGRDAATFAALRRGAR